MSFEKIEILNTIHRIFAFGVSDVIIKISKLKLKKNPNSALGVYNTVESDRQDFDSQLQSEIIGFLKL